MPGCGCYHDQLPPAVQHAIQLSRVTRGEHDHRDADGTGADRELLPRVRDNGPDPGMGARGAPGGVLGRIEGDARMAGSAVQDARQVVAGSSAHIEDAGVARHRAHRFPAPGREQPGELLIMPTRQEAVTGADHRSGVGITAARPAGEQVDVSLPGDVETVTARAQQGGAVVPEPSPANRAAKEPRHVGEHDGVSA